MESLSWLSDKKLSLKKCPKKSQIALDHVLYGKSAQLVSCQEKIDWSCLVAGLAPKTRSPPLASRTSSILLSQSRPLAM